MIVVVVVVATVAAIVVPNAVGTSDMQALSAARMVSQDLEYAQNMAVTMAEPVQVRFNQAGKSYDLFLPNQSKYLKNPITKGDYIVNFSSTRGFGELTFSRMGFAGSKVQFDNLGSPDAEGFVWLLAGSNQYEVRTAAATGRVTVKKL